MSQPKNNRMVSAVLVILTGFLLAGCLQPDSANGEEEGPRYSNIDEYKLGKDDLAPGLNSRIAAFRAADPNVSIQLNVTNGRPDSAPGGTWNGCGSIGIHTVPQKDDPSVNRLLWHETSGRGGMVAADDEPFVIDGPGASENLFLGSHFSGTIDFHLSSGDVMLLELSVDQGKESIYDPEIALTSVNGTLELIETIDHRFYCQPNLESFSGTYAAVGYPPMPSLVIDARDRLVTRENTTALFQVFHPLVPAYCDIEILLEGRSVGQMESDTGNCEVGMDGPAGNVTFVVNESRGNSPVFTYYLWDRPPSASFSVP